MMLEPRGVIIPEGDKEKSGEDAVLLCLLVVQCGDESMVALLVAEIMLPVDNELAIPPLLLSLGLLALLSSSLSSSFFLRFFIGN